MSSIASAYRARHNLPRNIPFQAFDINQDPLQLHNRQRRMRIVQLDSHLVGELPPRSLGLLEPPHDIVQRRSDPKVLLLKTQFLATLKVIIRVQHGADGLSTLLVRHGTLVVAAVELLEVELAARRFARPETKVVGCGGVVAWDGDVVGHGLDDFAAFPDGDSFAIGCLFVDLAEELDLDMQRQRILVNLGGEGHIHRQLRRDEETPRG